MRSNKNKFSVYALILFSCITIPSFVPSAYAQTTNLVNLRAILPGVTETVDVLQKGTFPLGCQHFLIGVLGKGTLGISLVKSDRSGDIIFMTGLVSSSAGTFPIARTGVSKGVLSQIVEIGDDDAPYGFVWIYSGVSFSSADPGYTYQIRFSLAP